MKYQYFGKTPTPTPTPNNIQLGFYIDCGGNLIIYHEMKPSSFAIKKYGYSDSDKIVCSHTIKQSKLRQIPKSIKTRFRNRFESEHQWVLFFKDLNKYIGMYRVSGKNWVDTVPLPVSNWLLGRLEQYKNEMDEHCVDNYRAANVRKSSQMRRYRRDQKSGCCGFFDVKEVCPIDHNEYIMGFNYGH